VQQYIHTDQVALDGHLGFDTIALRNNHINTQAQPIYFQTFFPTTIKVSSDSFVYKVKVRMREVESTRCPFILCEIFGQQGTIYFKSVPKGCASEATVHLGRHQVSGKQVDLSAICTDVYQWTVYELKVTDHQLMILKEGVIVYIVEDLDPIGLLTGLGFLSSGLVEVDDVSLKGVRGEIVYEDDFEER
jgi:hypothetical protein